jgi:hypothetical protein
VMIALFPLTSNIFNIFRTIYYWSAKIIQNFFFQNVKAYLFVYLVLLSTGLFTNSLFFTFVCLFFVTCLSSFYFI